MKIDGLTKQQKYLLETMWNIDTKEEVMEWAETLFEDEYNTVRGLLELVRYQFLDDALNADMSEFYEETLTVLGKAMK